MTDGKDEKTAELEYVIDSTELNEEIALAPTLDRKIRKRTGKVERRRQRCEQQRRRRAALRERGMKEITLWIPASAEAEVRAAVRNALSHGTASEPSACTPLPETFRVTNS
jgi:hypothetical protein